MIISRTPLRVSFVGGGTDLPVFCNKERGAVISTAIKKYVYVMVHTSFDENILLSYRKIEIIDNVENVQNTRIKEAMKMTGVVKGVEIHINADTPVGTGLGSSSSFTVGLLNALYAYKGKNISAERLAKEAAEIEIKILKEPIGRQDQYSAAFGGINKIEFINEDVKIKPIIFNSRERDNLENRFMLFYLGGQRSASKILKSQSKNLDDYPKLCETYIQMRNLADELEHILHDRNFGKIGDILNRNWILKQKLSSEITNERINKYYDIAINAGAEGGKLLGAGGSGFLLFYVDYSKQDLVREALKDLKESKIKIDIDGSKIIYVGD